MVKIVNELMPDEEGIFFDSVANAESALAYMIADYKRRRFTVKEVDQSADGKPRYSVIDEARRPFGIYYLET
jgi:hypothetical protein